jgi:hypothetical protein
MVDPHGRITIHFKDVLSVTEEKLKSHAGIPVLTFSNPSRPFHDVLSDALMTPFETAIERRTESETWMRQESRWPDSDLGPPPDGKASMG